MTVPATPRRAGPFYGDGSATQFPFAFKVYARSDVLFTVALPGGNAAPLVLDTDYTVTLNSNQDTAPGGYVTYPITGSPLAVGGVAAITGNLAYTQPTDLPDGGAYRARNVETMSDRIVMLVQQVKEALGRTFTFPPTDGIIPVFPPVSERANRLLGFDSNGQFVGVLPVSGSAAALGLDLADTAVTSKGDALIGVRQPFPGTAGRTQHSKNADFISLGDFPGAVADGVTNVDLCVSAAEAAAASLGITSIYLPPGNWAVSGNFAFSCRYWGAGAFVYSGRGTVTFTGTGLNDLSVTGTAIGVRPLTVFVEATTTGSPNGYRFSVDGGVTWVSTFTEILPGDIEVTTPLVMTTAPQAISHTGVSISWGSVNGHTTGNRWTFTLRPNPKVIDAGNAIVMRNQVAAWIDGDRSVGFGQNVMGKGRSISFENVGVGVDVLEDNQTGYGNVAVGVRAGQKNIDGFLNTYMGTWAGRDCTSGDGNTAIGAYSQIVTTTGGYNTSVGNDALSFPNAGSENVAVGVQALHGNDENQTGGWTPQRNTAVGVQAMRDVENAANCSVVGFSVAPVAKSITALSALGYNAYANLTTGNNNTGLGTQAGSSITTGSGNLFLGFGAGLNGLQKVDAVNTFAIGQNAYTTTNNTGVIGNSSTTDIFMWGNWKPQVDNGQDIGSALARMRTIYAGTGTINTSDERLKTDIRSLSEAERRVALQLKGRIGAFKFLDAIEDKGDGARWHFGIGAQTVAAAFSAEGLDATHYGLFCYDEWPEEWAQWDAQPDATPPREAGRKLMREAGNRYGVRYDELAMFILAAL